MPMPIAKFGAVCFEALGEAWKRKDFLSQVPVFFQKAALFLKKVALDVDKVALDDESVALGGQQNALVTGEALFAKADTPIERRMEKPFTVSS